LCLHNQIAKNNLDLFVDFTEAEGLKKTTLGGSCTSVANGIQEIIIKSETNETRLCLQEAAFA
jgi:hypothetical protein